MPLSETELLDSLEKNHVFIRNSHIVYTSGKHGSSYFNKDAIYPHTLLTSDICENLARRFVDNGIETVVGPALGGIILSQWIAHHLTLLTGREVMGVYAEKENDGFVIKRGYDAFVVGKKVLVVEDVITTGGSVKKVIEKIKELGGEVGGLACLCNRGNLKTTELNVSRIEAIVQIQWDAWDSTQCPLCAKGRPVNTAVGKGREFLSGK